MDFILDSIFFLYDKSIFLFLFLFSRFLYYSLCNLSFLFFNSNLLCVKRKHNKSKQDRNYLDFLFCTFA
jgi:hypothetical protein